MSLSMRRLAVVTAVLIAVGPLSPASAALAASAPAGRVPIAAEPATAAPIAAAPAIAEPVDPATVQPGLYGSDDAPDLGPDTARGPATSDPVLVALLAVLRMMFR